MGEPAKVPQTEVRRVRRALLRLAATWPKGLWIFAAGGDLHLMLGNADGTHAMVPGGNSEVVDQSRILDTIPIDSDGGDW